MNDNKRLNVFIRQPFTGAKRAEQQIVGEVMAVLKACDGQPHRFNILTGDEAQSSSTFKQAFSDAKGVEFSAHEFRKHRLGLIDKADLFVNIRAAMSESGAYELAYHIHGRREQEPRPILFLHWRTAPFETTLLKELHHLAPTQYLPFDNASDLQEPLLLYFNSLRRNATVARH